MPLVLITVGLIAQQLASSGSLHTFGVIDVVLGVTALVFWAIAILVKSVDA